MKSLKKDWPLYIMVIPGVLFLIIFRFIPLGASVMAFQDYSLTRGVFGSEWAGLAHFKTVVSNPNILKILWNTAVIAFYNLIFLFPVAVIFALLVNELKNGLFKRGVQTVSYLPYLFSWVIISGLTIDLLATRGLINNIRALYDLKPLMFLQDERYFRGLIVLTGIWKDTGWNSIVILAAIAGISPDYYEAALIDGATKGKQVRYITLPLLYPTLIILFLLRIGNFLDLSFDHIFNFLTPMTYNVGDVIATYVYRVGILQGQFSLTTAVGLLQSVIGLILITLCNKLSNRVSGEGLW